MPRYRIPGSSDGEIIFAVCLVIALALGFIGLPIFVWVTLTSPPYAAPEHSVTTPSERIEEGVDG